MLFMAPQLVHKRPYSFKADIWSVGVILFNLLNGVTPFECRTMAEFEMKHKIYDYTMKPESKEVLTLECLNMMTSCLQNDENLRANYNDLYNHPYITNPIEE